jgi:PIN domain nuclease of toxin-antitoxin system
MNIILDACAIISFYRDEKGVENVKNFLFDSDNNCLIHAVNLGEVYYDFYRSGSEEEAEEIIQDLLNINVTIRNDLTTNFWRQVVFGGAKRIINYGY